MDKFYKYVKIIAFFAALFGNIVWQNTTWGCIKHLSLVFIFASFCYLAIALFALLRPFIGLIFGLIATLFLLFSLAWVGDWIVGIVPFANEDTVLWIFVVIICVFLIKDILWVYNYLKSEWKVMKKINKE